MVKMPSKAIESTFGSPRFPPSLGIAGVKALADFNSLGLETGSFFVTVRLFESPFGFIVILDLNCHNLFFI